ncbi:MAG: hypothetical protein FH749_06045 [Firmicutes bacterium]|nr:hypothetical protein [Bacillota bacterium]
MSGKYFFLVLFLSKNRRLLWTLAVLLGIVLAVWLLVSFTNFLVATMGQEADLPFTVVYQDPTWKSQVEDQSLPQFFVAGGISYDEEILVEGWGLARETLVPVDYFNDLGIHVLHGRIERVSYSDQRLNIYINQADAGYQMATISKKHFTEGDLQVVFVDEKGVPLAYEEEYIYSVPVEYVVLQQEEKAVKTVFMEVIDAGALEAATGSDLQYAAVQPYLNDDYLVLWVQGGTVSIAQRQQNTLRLYMNTGSTTQVLAFQREQLASGQVTVRLIDSEDLSLKEQIDILNNN